MLALQPQEDLQAAQTREHSSRRAVLRVVQELRTGSEQVEQLLNDLGGVRGGIGKFLGDKADALADFTGISKFFADEEEPKEKEQAKDVFIEPPNTLDDLGEEPSTAQRMKAAARRKQGRRL